MSLTKMKIHSLLKKINKLAPKMRKMTDEQLQAQTEIFRKKLQSGKKERDILPEAFATVREADYRVLGMFPYDVQVIGAIILNEGAIAEMRTGEGKTLTATMPLYLNALSGKGAMLVTPNDYLAARDEEDLAPVYKWLGLTISKGFDEKLSREGKKVSPIVKRAWYASDIVYTTASSLAFDYLFDNLATSKDGQYLRPYNYVIIDEVDEVLLDEAESPFVISSRPKLQSNLYDLTDRFVKLLKEKRDYRIKKDLQLFWLTYHGIKFAENYFRISNLFSEQNRELYRHIMLAMQAHLFMRKGHEYLVVRGKVVLLDEEDGRLKEGVQVGTGLHQAIEAKEHVKQTAVQKVAASITFPSLFSLFNKVSGMSGTVKGDQNEFLKTYNLKVYQVPTRKKVIRKDYPAKIYLTTSDKLMAAIHEVIKLHNEGRPVLIVAGSVENSEIISELLLNDGIAHNVLNAFNIVREAEIVKNAGQAGAVTVATNMAGRGTDIKLGPGVKEKGGLAVIGTEMLSSRVKGQLAGRAGRQGDPGTSQFYVSLEDRYISHASTGRLKKYYRKLMRKKKNGADIVQLSGIPLKVGLKMLRERVEVKGVMSRMQTNKYEVVLRMQRDHFYQQRKKIMYLNDLQDNINQYLKAGINNYLSQRKNWTQAELRYLINEHFSYDYIKDLPTISSKKEIEKFLFELSQKILQDKAQILINREQLNEFFRQVILSAMDACWVDQMDYLSNLKLYVDKWNLAGYESDYVYQQRAYEAFEKMQKNIQNSIVDKLLLSPIHLTKEKKLVVVFN
ncbi:MAG: accessory Sec system translocase SecA2 [Lactobacillus crispatus]|jgi:preprotein translocase subunit SecA|uniref:accessory Sec system translocase SecA2 n=1 Tax=Lactobacillus crispatus TaxID=47770 RepID=UPI0018AA664E|nr:accessory Sec system translocase SecA2 [Lactobacillus crispatus]MCH4003980.1 accessory Sec system translocase SecA2 [Lactobacillus crispatus]MCI1336059.1 accessory Sec system translocase SecA2 [Lactobacillus crispatus]MCI1365549.1 accessory Sec system translocase SecA2 [Lactobacillus crispatus]MCI1494505.1 accessory Sec system translocase SecA2 [Lactobacillus crispatus]MCI1538239.1 accessory Sec system translocase SecA2 [Lactobacillus crispatus]